MKQRKSIYSLDFWLNLYRPMYCARVLDEWEEKLVYSRQSNFYIPCAGHEGSVIFHPFLFPEDWLMCHYRDKALVLARGESPESFFRAALAKRSSSSGGMRMPGFPSNRQLKILSTPTLIGNGALHAVGVAQFLVDNGQRGIVFCGIGDGGTQEGEFFEAIAEAARQKLPVLFVVEDNHYALSTPTLYKTFYSFPNADSNSFMGLKISHLCGYDIPGSIPTVAQIIQEIREYRIPQIVVMNIERLKSHTSSDDHKIYRPIGEIERISRECDPVFCFREWLRNQGVSVKDIEAVETEEALKVEKALQTVRQEESPDEVQATMTKRPISCSVDTQKEEASDEGGSVITMGEALRRTLDYLLAKYPEVTVNGQDLEDPKGDVFGVTRGLSTKYPGRVTNSPLSEATIIGKAIGQALAGGKPIVFCQFADFISVGYNQLVNEMATMFWRTAGNWEAPVILLAPCGAYRPGLGPFHGETPTTQIACNPGLDVFIPSRAKDIAGLLLQAVENRRPTVILYPKSFLNDQTRGDIVNLATDRIYPGKAHRVCQGDDLTMISWGTPMVLCEKATEFLSKEDIGVDLWDLRSINPWDKQAVLESAKKTRRVLIVQEENQFLGMGSEIIREIAETLDNQVQVRCLARKNTWIPYHYQTQLLVLPSYRDILEASAQLLGCRVQWVTRHAASGDSLIVYAFGPSPSDQNLKITELLVKEGTLVHEGDPLASIEADKATTDLLSPCNGIITELLLKEGDAVSAGTPFLKIKPDNLELLNASIMEQIEPVWISHKKSEHQEKNVNTHHPVFQKVEPIITSISMRLGSTSLPNERLILQNGRWSSEDIYNRTGILHRYWIDPQKGEDVISLAIDACRQVLQQESLDLREIDAIICSTGTPLYMTPSVACTVLTSLADGKIVHIPAYDLNAACSGYLYALQQAYDLFNSGKYQTILIITTETLSPLLDSQNYETYFLFGDAATATILRTSPVPSGNINYRLYRPVLSAVPDPDRNLYVPLLNNHQTVQMNGVPVFRMAVREMIRSLYRVCEENHLSLNDLDLIVPHQANARIIESIRKQLQLPQEKVFNMIEKVGNTSSNTIPIGLYTLMQEKKTRLPSRIGLTAFGGGFTFGGTILEKMGG